MATYDTFIVNGDLRTIQIPASCNGILGVESDEKVAQIPFRIPRYYGDLDLTTFEPRVNYLNANGEIGVTICTFSETDDEYAFFTWEVDRRATRYVGTTSFVVCLILTDADGTILREFNTTVQKLEVLAGIEAENQLENEYTDIISYILNRLDEASLATTYTIAYEDGDIVLIGEDGSRSAATIPDSSIALFRVSVDETTMTTITAEAATEREMNIVPGEMVNILFLGTTDVCEYLTLDVTYSDPSAESPETRTYQLYNQRQSSWPSVPEGTLLTAVCTGTDILQVISVPEGSDITSLSTRVDQNSMDIGSLNTTMSQVQAKQNEHASAISEFYNDKSASIFSSSGKLFHTTVGESTILREAISTVTIQPAAFNEAIPFGDSTIYCSKEVRVDLSSANYNANPRSIQLTVRTSETASGNYPAFATVIDATKTSMTIKVFSFAPITQNVTIYYHVIGTTS